MYQSKSVDGKMIAQKSQPQVGGATVSDNVDIDPFGTEEKRPTGKAVGDQVRMGSNIRPSSNRSEEWEVDNETMEDAGYRTTPSDEDDH